MTSRPGTRRDACRGLAVFALCIAASCCGCRKADVGRYRVHGTVEYQGRPVPLGRIVFEPDLGRGNRGPQGFAPIEDGRFDTDHRFCKGATGGPTIVRIDGFETAPSTDGDATTAGRRLFETYETRIDLPLTSNRQEFTVPAAGKP